MKGVAISPSPKNRLSRLSTEARCDPPMSLTSVFPEVTITPPPKPSVNQQAMIIPYPATFGSVRSEAVTILSPSNKPVFLPRLSMRGPAEREATLKPSA